MILPLVGEASARLRMLLNDRPTRRYCQRPCPSRLVLTHESRRTRSRQIYNVRQNEILSESGVASFQTEWKATPLVFKPSKRRSRQSSNRTKMKPTGKGRIGIGERSAKESASAAAEFSVFGGASRSPNKAPLPTTMSVTRRADARHAPDTVAAEL